MLLRAKFLRQRLLRVIVFIKKIDVECSRELPLKFPVRLYRQAVCFMFLAQVPFFLGHFLDTRLRLLRLAACCLRLRLRLLRFAA